MVELSAEEETMTFDLNLSREAETRLRELAAAAGQDLQAFVLQTLNERLSEYEPQPTVVRTNEEWTARLRSCIQLHPLVTHLVDDSRESIYAGRGE
jgi:hypothetical protein